VVWIELWPSRNFDLFQVDTALAAELGAGAAEVVGAEALDADLFGSLLHHRPDRPVAQALADPAALADGAQ
jgi:hypothetical protein